MTHDNPLVSIVLPTYNRHRLLNRAINSVKEQTYDRWELVVVNDNSTDETSKLLAKFKDERIKVVNNEKNLGGAASRNKGMKYTKGDYIAFIDDDDRWLPQKLNKQVSLIEDGSNQVGLIHSGYYIESEKGKRRYKRPWLSGDAHAEVKRLNGVGNPSNVLIDYEVVRTVGYFDTDLPACIDWDYWIRVSEHFDIDFVDEPLSVYSFHQGSSTHDVDRFIKAYERLWEKHDILDSPSKVTGTHYLRLGHNVCVRGDSQRGRRYILKSYYEEPFKIWRLAQYALALIGTSVYTKITHEIKEYTSRIVPYI